MSAVRTIRHLPAPTWFLIEVPKEIEIAHRAHRQGVEALLRAQEEWTEGRSFAAVNDAVIEFWREQAAIAMAAKQFFEARRG
jgi:hypothetical protein